MVCRTWRGIAEGDSATWRARCKDDFDMEESILPTGARYPTFRLAWLAARKEYKEFFRSDEDSVVFNRACKMWKTIKAWLAANAPDILDTIAPGISAEDLAALEARLQLPIPTSVRAIYRLHNGQDEAKVPNDFAFEMRGRNWLGLL
eukprot:CAMPEP_0172164274 /NCGR_PEP_ID=MMETSP1050-20130122/7752_1 /TAXON_ID=233186 /ORGANISM="Cryptomonas curvata, Strain CCAP979/52" /LENGTH=146 /DNA_ID=CAMNT_0012834589 /DNA_START=21 /DNA_END=458 /DNA_ORIENTATION=-